MMAENGDIRPNEINKGGVPGRTNAFVESAGESRASVAARAVVARDCGPLGGVALIAVEPGTEIENPLTGEKRPVTETSMVCFGHTFYVTPTVYEKIKAASNPAPDNRA